MKTLITGINDSSDINAKVKDTLNDWFGVEYELVEG